MDKRIALNIKFHEENAAVIAAINNALHGFSYGPGSERYAIKIVKENFPSIDDTDITRLRKAAIIRHIRRQEPYKEAVEKECRRQWLRQSIDIYQMLLDSNRLESELRSGLKFDPVEDKAHSEFYFAYVTMPTSTQRLIVSPRTLEKIKWDIVDKYQDQVEL